MKPKDLALTIALGGAGGGGGGGDEDITKGTMAPTFSAETAYTAGDYVWHSGKLYRFTADHAAGSWDGTDAEEAPLSAGISDIKGEINELEPLVLATFPQTTITDEAIATFSDGADGVPIKALTVEIEPVQSGTGDPAPDNVRPISGWTGVNVTDCGKNLYPASTIPEYYYTWYSHPDFEDAVEPVLLKAGVTYVVSGERSAQQSTWFFLVRMFDVLGNNVEDESMISGGIATFTYTYVSGGKYFQPTGSGASSLYQTITPAIDCYVDLCVQSGRGTATNAMIEVGSTPTSPYAPYVGSTLPITFPDTAGTVYGGSLKLNEDGSADLTVVNAAVTFDGSNDETINNQSSTDSKRISIALPSDSMVWDKGNENSGKLLSNEFEEITNTQSYGGSIGIHYRANSSHEIIVSFGDVAWTSVVAEAKAWLSSNPLQVVYWLATPVTYHIEDVGVVKTLLGMNNLWADTGDVDPLTYRVDPASYQAAQTAQIISALAAMLSYTETSYTATRAYNENDFVSVNNTLYRVTASISNGGTITPDTNCTETTVGAELTTILNS